MLKFFKSTFGIIVIILIVLALILLYFNWDSVKRWFSGSVIGNAVAGEAGRASIMDALDLSRIPSNLLSQLGVPEQGIISNFFNRVKAAGGANDQDIQNVNSELGSIGSGTSFVRNDASGRAKCREGQNCWTLNLIIFTMCHCQSYPQS